MRTKEELRKKYLQLRQNLSQENLKKYNQDIFKNLRKIEAIWEKQHYHIFLSANEKKEVDTSTLLAFLKQNKKTIYIPKIDNNTQTLKTCLIDHNTKIKIGTYGISEPEEPINEQNPEILEVMFVPLLVFDKKGNRIGYGKGFYDKLLEHCKPNLLKIGLSFFEAENQIPAEPFDIKLDVCITPQKLYNFNEAGC